MKVLTVVGARPQFVKAAVVSTTLRRRHHEVLVHTGQHYDVDMSDRFFRELNLPSPDYELGVGSGSHAQQTARMLVGIEQAIQQERPEMVLVYGDTNSTLAGALAAAKLHVRVAHVEAGLRSFNRRMPEETNRIVTDHVSDLLFCPGDNASRNLAREGITRGVHVVGDVMAETLRQFASAAPDQSVLDRLGLTSGSYVVATVHRAENTDDRQRLIAIMHALDEIDDEVIVPAHPRLREALNEIGWEAQTGVRVIDPVGYTEMIELQRHARVILTDSGGVQKEAYWLGVPCVTLRDETEWIETVEAGWNQLVGADTARIIAAAQRAVRTPDRPPLYGDGTAVDAIVHHLSPTA
jgi:UDP-GlcNAc3NAcA epimerase